MAFYFRYTNNEFDALFPKIRLAEFKNLPIKIIDSTAQNKLKYEVNKLLESQGEINKKISKFTDYLAQIYKLDKFSKKLQNWHNLEFGEFIKELNKAIKATNKVRTKEGNSPIPELTKKDEFEWMELFEENKKKAVELQREIENTDKEIDLMVYKLYDLTYEEVFIVDEGFGMSKEEYEK